MAVSKEKKGRRFSLSLRFSGIFGFVEWVCLGRRKERQRKRDK
jgi:hypothetical protein